MGLILNSKSQLVIWVFFLEVLCTKVMYIALGLVFIWHGVDIQIYNWKFDLELINFNGSKINLIIFYWYH